MGGENESSPQWLVYWNEAKKIRGHFALFGLLLWLAYTKKKQKGGALLPMSTSFVTMKQEQRRLLVSTMSENWKWELLWQKRNMNKGCGDNKNKGSFKNKKIGTNDILCSKSLKHKNEKTSWKSKVNAIFFIYLVC
jgi:hypothetical protein